MPVFVIMTIKEKCEGVICHAGRDPASRKKLDCPIELGNDKIEKITGEMICQ